MAHDIAVENTFRGPMDLLLYLVKRDEIDIHDIPISHLTTEYLAEMDKLDDLDVDVASEFMSMASMLVEIKSRMLLPPTTSEEDEDEDNFDPRAGLVQALLEYKRFKEAAALLGDMAEYHAGRFARLAPQMNFDDQEEGTIEEVGSLDLYVAFEKMIRNMLASEAQEIVYDEVPTETRIRQIMETVDLVGSARFSLLLSSEPTKGEMVGFFIAMLEIIRLKKIWARQSADFSDIIIEKRESGDERYALPATDDAESSPVPNKLCLAPLFPPVPFAAGQTYFCAGRSGVFPAAEVFMALPVASPRPKLALFNPVRTYAKFIHDPDAISLLPEIEPVLPEPREVAPRLMKQAAEAVLIEFMPSFQAGFSAPPVLFGLKRETAAAVGAEQRLPAFPAAGSSRPPRAVMRATTGAGRFRLFP
jgi:segregation and condensation protein A